MALDNSNQHLALKCFFYENKANFGMGPFKNSYYRNNIILSVGNRKD